jgi:hypothetical protein
VPVEIVFDVGIGDTFNGRIGGNVVNDDLLGSMKFGRCPAQSWLWSWDIRLVAR